MQKKISSIELVRFFAALSVVLFHYNICFNQENVLSTEILPLSTYFNYLYRYGYYGVDIFFIISGFVFSSVYLDSKATISAKSFFIKRFARLYPLHLATLIILIFIGFLDFNFFEKYHSDNQIYTDFYHFFLQFFFISFWGFEDGYSFNAPSWSISIEIGIYIFFFFLINLLKIFKKKLSLIIKIFFFILTKLKNIDFIFDQYLFLFFMGVVIYQIPKFKNSIALILIALFAIIFSFVGNFKILLFCPALLILILILENLIQKNNFQNIFNFLGNMSYSIYLIHYPLIFFFLMLENKEIMPSNYYYNFSFTFFFLVLLFLLSFLSFKFFENPINKKIRSKFL